MRKSEGMKNSPLKQNSYSEENNSVFISGGEATTQSYSKETIIQGKTKRREKKDSVSTNYGDQTQ